MKDSIQEIAIGNFNLSLSEMRVINMPRILQVEKSMRLHGQLQPVIARADNGSYQLIDGFKRYYAAEDLMMETLLCHVLEIDLRQAKVLLLSYNRPHQSMEVWEEAMVLQDLQQTHHMDQKQLAGLTGYSRSWVSRRLSLVEKMDQEVSSQIRMGVLTGSHARALTRLPRGNQGEVARAIADFSLTSRQSDALVEAFLRAKNQQQQSYILTHPDQVFFEDRDPEQDEPYDARLSCFGNELMHSMGHLYRWAHTMCSKLDDPRMDMLKKSEKGIIVPHLQHAFRDCRKLTELIARLQTHKTPREDEK